MQHDFLPTQQAAEDVNAAQGPETEARRSELSSRDLGLALDAVRESTPLVQAITNTVVTNFTANVLLALGAAPAMVDIEREAGPFAAVASGVLINLGTPYADRALAMREAVAAANEAHTPWVLDPVAIGSLPVRTALAHDLVELRPTAIRGNASEILAAAGEGQGGRGVDATAGVDAAEHAARELAQRTGAVVAVSGASDFITDGERAVYVANGTPLLTQVTGGGCALGAVMTAFVGSGDDRFTSIVAASVSYEVAAEHAVRELIAEGLASSNADAKLRPGSFAVRFVDALASVTALDIEREARVTAA